MADIMSIGVSALNAAQYGLMTTQNNIANASTPGYNRQETLQAENIPQATGSGYLGQGVNVSSVQRIFSAYLTTQLLQQQAQSSQLNTYYTQIQQINNVIADPVAGLQPAIQRFFSAVNGVANAPGSQPARQAMLGSAQTLSTQFQSMNQLLTSMNSSVNSQITSSVTSINSFAQQIAALNTSITVAQTATGQPPNALLDQRDQLVSQLNQQVQTSVVTQSDGSYSVFIGNGQALVVGNQAFSLQTVQSQSDPGKLDVAYSIPGGSGVTRLQQSSLQGGNLGGLLAFRDQTLTQAQNQLGLVADGLAATINAQQSVGQDLNGAMGSNLFNIGTPVVYSNTNNTGTAQVSASISNVSALTGSDYSLAYDGTNYTVTRLSDNTATSSATLPMTVDGVTIGTTSGTPNPGDKFLIRPTANGAAAIGVAMADTSKIAAASPVTSMASLGNTGTGTVRAPTVNPPADANLQQAVTITFNNPPTTYNVTGTGTGLPATNVAYTPGASITYNGWTTQISGTPNANDVFTVTANSNAMTDGNNALLMAGLETKNTLLGGTASFEGVYGQLVSQIGNQTSALKTTSQSAANMVIQTTQAQQSISGVNLDEEAANLIRYQQAYQAAGKAIQVANTLFDTVLNLQK